MYFLLEHAPRKCSGVSPARGLVFAGVTQEMIAGFLRALRHIHACVQRVHGPERLCLILLTGLVTAEQERG